MDVCVDAECVDAEAMGTALLCVYDTEARSLEVEVSGSEVCGSCRRIYRNILHDLVTLSQQ